MPIELILSPFMRPVVKAYAYTMGFHRESSHYTPLIVDNYGANPTKYVLRKEFGTGSKIMAVYPDGKTDNHTDKIYHMVRSRAVKGSYKIYAKGDDKPIGALRAGLRSNVCLYRTESSKEIDLGWHTIDHCKDALDDYRYFQLSDGNTYQWTYKGQFLERVRNYGEKEAEVRERVGRAIIHPNRQGFDLIFNNELIVPEMAISTAMVCYIEAWNTTNAYGGIYLAARSEPLFPWKRS